MASIHFDRKFGKAWIASVPDEPGVYQFLDEQGAVFYVGKASSLRRRLRQYRLARARPKRDRKMARLVKLAFDIRWRVCASELDACLEELKLIQELRPKENITGNYFFLYPFVGLCVRDDTNVFDRATAVPGAAARRQLRLCLTARLDLFPEYRLHGAFRSRWIVVEAFFGLVELLRFVGASLGPKELAPERARARSYTFGFRRLPPGWEEGWEKFFRGESANILGELTTALLDKAGARAKAAEIQKHLDALSRFFDDEARPLQQAIRATAYPHYPVPQAERDPLFLKFRRGLTSPAEQGPCEAS